MVFTTKDLNKTFECLTPSGKMEKFTLKKVAKKFVYFVSAEYSSDGWWKTNKINIDNKILVNRCKSPF